MPCIRHGAGLLFCPDTIQPQTSVYSVFCRVHANYTAHAAKQRTGLYSGFSCDCARSTAYDTSHDTRPAKAGVIPPATRWRAYTRPDALNRYQIPPPRKGAAQVNTTVYYNKVYKRVQGCAPVMDPCQTVQRIADHASQAGSAPTVCGGVSISTCTRLARRLAIWHRSAAKAHRLAPSTRRGSPTAGGAEPLAALAASLFGLSPDS